jgi:Na+/melibiose symporter-like transporter
MHRAYIVVLGIPLAFLPARMVLAAAPSGSGAVVLATFIQNLTRWFEYLAGLLAVATVAYGGLRHTLAHSPRAQADAWRIVLAGLGGLVIALLAPTIVGIVQGMIPS